MVFSFKLISFYFTLFILSTQAVQELKDLIYTAAETGAQQFLEMLFATSAGTLAFDAYKDSLPLPEVVAMNHGHEKTARYLEDVTARYVSHVVGTTNEYDRKKRWAWVCREKGSVDLFELKLLVHTEAVLSLSSLCIGSFL